MKYTKYFSLCNKAYGPPSLNSKQHDMYMNIIHLEAKIKAYGMLDKNVLAQYNLYRPVRAKLEKWTEELNAIVLDREPEVVLKEMIIISQ